VHDILQIRDDAARNVLTTLKGIATADGTLPLHDIHRKTLEAIATNLFSTTVDIDALPDTAAAAANQVPENIRREVIHLAGIIPVLEDEHKLERAKALHAVSRQWGVEAAFTKAIEDVAHNHKARLLMHALQESRVELGASTLQELWGLVVSRMHLDGHPEIYARYNSYRSYPEGSFGKVMTEYYDDNEFELPGKPGNYFSNYLIKHDFHHVLSGYTTSPMGELAVQYFDDGISKVDYSSALVGISAQIQIAMVFDSSIPAWINQIDPEIMFRAKRRGLDCTENYLDTDYDFEPLMKEQLSDVRQRFNISEEGMMVQSKSDKWCGPLGPPYKRVSDQLIKRESLHL